MENNEKTEKIIVECEHCHKKLDLGKEDTCPHCNKSCFLEPNKIGTIVCYADEKLVIYVDGEKDFAGNEILHKSIWMIDRYSWTTHNELHVYIKKDSEMKVERIMKADCNQLKLDL